MASLLAPQLTLEELSLGGVLAAIKDTDAVPEWQGMSIAAIEAVLKENCRKNCTTRGTEKAKKKKEKKMMKAERAARIAMLKRKLRLYEEAEMGRAEKEAVRQLEAGGFSEDSIRCILWVLVGSYFGTLTKRAQLQEKKAGEIRGMAWRLSKDMVSSVVEEIRGVFEGGDRLEAEQLESLRDAVEMQYGAALKTWNVYLEVARDAKFDPSE